MFTYVYPHVYFMLYYTAIAIMYFCVFKKYYLTHISLHDVIPLKT